MRFDRTQNTRYHFLDATRASMMLLGILVHARLSFMLSPTVASDLGDGTQPVCDLFYYLIHAFRMPVFFLIAGFCAALIYQRRGAQAFYHNRLQRIALPMLVAWLITYPIIRAGYFYVHGNDFAASIRHVMSGEFLADARLSYLWFLYYLAIYCGLALVLTPATCRVPVARREACRELFDRLLTARSAPYVLSLSTMIMLFSMNRPFLEHSMNWLPNWRPLVAYWIFFVVGWALYNRSKPFDLFQKHLRSNTIAAIAVTTTYLYLMANQVFSNEQRQLLLTAPLASIASWLWVFAIVGAGARFFDRPNAVVQYLSDAAYWVYLAHFPLVIWTIGITSRTALSSWAKFSVVLTVAAAVPLASYHFLVRRTWLGELLGGKREAAAQPVAIETQPETPELPTDQFTVPALKLYDPAELELPTPARQGPARRRRAA